MHQRDSKRTMKYNFVILCLDFKGSIPTLTMSKRVQFLFFATPFYYEVLKTLKWDIIPFSLRK